MTISQTKLTELIGRDLCPDTLPTGKIIQIALKAHADIWGVSCEEVSFSAETDEADSWNARIRHTLSKAKVEVSGSDTIEEAVFNLLFEAKIIAVKMRDGGNRALDVIFGKEGSVY